MITYRRESESPSLKFNKQLGLDLYFSKRELEVLKLIAEGHNSRQTAKRLCLSMHTINVHRKTMLRRSGHPNMVSLVAFCIREAILQKLYLILLPRFSGLYLIMIFIQVILESLHPHNHAHRPSVCVQSNIDHGHIAIIHSS